MSPTLRESCGVFGVYSPHEDVARMLMSNGANVNAADQEGRTALMQAAVYGHVDVARALLSNGAEVNAKDREGRTALTQASTYGHADVVRLLLSNGAGTVVR